MIHGVSQYVKTITVTFFILCIQPCYASNDQQYALDIISGIFYGPGEMPDSPLPTGRLGHITLDKNLTGRTKYFNNGGKLPNIKSEKEIDGIVDGKLSNGIPFNEHIDGGIAEVGLGAMRFMTVVAGDGPNKGSEKFTLLDSLDWQIITDLALDPGFADGVVISNNLLITTGLLSVPFSLQTSEKKEGGMDTAGSLPSGLDIVGRLGDFDFDGYIDGIINGGSNLPLDHMLIPGAPVIQSRYFTSNIPIDSFHASVLMISGIKNYHPVFTRIFSTNKDAATFYAKASVISYIDDIVMRIESAKVLLQKPASDFLPTATVNTYIDDLDFLKSHLDSFKKWKRKNIATGLHKYKNQKNILKAMARIEKIAATLKFRSKFKDI